jgi:hypothetical protein
MIIFFKKRKIGAEGVQAFPPSLCPPEVKGRVLWHLIAGIGSFFS